MRRRDQALDHLALFQMAFNNFIDVVVVNKTVPSPLRVDHCNRATRAPVQAARFVHANLTGSGQAHLFDAGFAVVKGSLSALKRTTGFTIFSFVQAEEMWCL
jgi:hypothetical protein